MLLTKELESAVGLSAGLAIGLREDRYRDAEQGESQQGGDGRNRPAAGLSRGWLDSAYD